MKVLPQFSTDLHDLFHTTSLWYALQKCIIKFWIYFFSKSYCCPYIGISWKSKKKWIFSTFPTLNDHNFSSRKKLKKLWYPLVEDIVRNNCANSCEDWIKIKGGLSIWMKFYEIHPVSSRIEGYHSNYKTNFFPRIFM